MTANTALSQTPSETDMLSPFHTTFLIKRLPTVTFMVQNLNIPGISLQNTIQHSPLVQRPMPGDHLDYDDIMINYKVDADMQNYMEIHSWIRSLGHPTNFNEFKLIKNKTQASGLSIFSDITVIIHNSNRIPVWEITFKDAMPISLSSLIFDVTKTDVDHIEAAATFKYSYYDIERIT